MNTSYQTQLFNYIVPIQVDSKFIYLFLVKLFWKTLRAAHNNLPDFCIAAGKKWSPLLSYM